ncbi:MAG TPA: S-layer homology domain-containing protein [Clostridia bacterium]|nr:S-layer homology domain-containing protein [Clostridia bacterium]
MHFAYIIGYPDNTVRPQNNITREEVSVMFCRLLEANYRNSIITTSS